MQAFADPRDRALLGATPTVMMPRFGELDELEPGRRRFIAARDGLYMEARTRALHACLLIAPSPVALPYGEGREFIRMAGGPIPAELVQDMARRVMEVHPNEWAGVVTFTPETGGYLLHEPRIEDQGRARVSYRTEGYEDDLMVLDVHSHGHFGATFSAVDDADDMANGNLYMAVVLGRCGAASTLEVSARVVAHGYLRQLDSLPWRT